MRKHLKILILTNFKNQREFALRIRMPEDILSRIIHTRRTPTLEQKQQILKGLGLTDRDSEFLFHDWSVEIRKETGENCDSN